MFEHTCPSPAVLSGFVFGTLPLTELEGVAQHLDKCSDCEARVNSLERVCDPVLAAIRHSGHGANVMASQSKPIADVGVPERLGDFRIIREIGRGGMGLVYEAEQISLGRRVALKVMPRHAHWEPESLERFRRESRAVAGLHHTNIVQVFGTGEHDDLHYFVMELIPGVGLDKVLRELKQARPVGKFPEAGGQKAPPDPSLMAVVRGLLSGTSSRSGMANHLDGRPEQAQEPEAHPALPPAPSSPGSGRRYWVRVARVGMQVAEGLAHAHAYGVIHRDIKPSNLLMDDRGTVWVADFGLAKAANEENVLTQSGDIIGTLRYLPPESLEGKSDARGDVYSLGVTLYELVTLRDAFPDVDRNVLLRRKLETELARPRQENPNVPRDLETIIVKAIARDPGHRYQTAAQLAADLCRFIEDRPVRARRITAPERLWRWCRRDPRTASLLGLLLLALVGGLLGVSSQWNRAEQKARDEARARALADKAQQQALAELYLSNIAQARLEWRLNNMARAERLLDHCEPERRDWEWHYLRGVNRPEQARLASPELSMIFGARFGPDGHFLAFSGWDYYRNPDGHAPTAAEIWDFSSGHKLYTLAVPGVGLQPTFSPDGRLLAFSGSSAAVSLWDAATGKLVRMLDERGDAAFSPDGRLLAVAGSTAITVHDVASGQLVRRFASRAGRVRFSPDGSLLAQSGPGSVSLRSTSTGEELGRLPFGPGDQMELFFPELGPQIAFAPAGDRLVAATSPPRVWDVATRRPLLTLAGHIGMVPGVAFGPDGRRIATAGADGTVRLWDAQTGAELAVLRGHTSIVSCVAFHPDGRALLSGGRQPGDVKIWDLTRPVEFGVLPAGGAWALAFDEHDRLKRIDHVGRIQTHDPETGQTDVGPRVDLIQKWISPGHLAAFSGDGRQVAAVSADLHSVKVFDARTGKEIAILGGLETLPRRLAFSADGHRVAAATLPGHSTTARVVRVWDARSGQVLSDFRPSSAGRQSGGAVALSADGRLVAFDDYSRTSADQPPDSVTAVVRVCDVMTSREQITVSAADGGVGCLAFSPDAVLLAASGENGHVLAWETATGRSRCEDHLDLAPLDLAFSPNSRRLAAVNREVVTIWDVQTGEGILTLRGSPPRPADLASNATLAWSHDGRWLAAVNWDGTVAVWDGEPHERPSTPGSFPQVSSARAYAWHLGEAEAARAGGQWAAAAFHLARVSATDPPDLATRERRGRLHLLRADWERAYADYAALFAATEPDGSQAWLDYARLLLLRHDYAGYGRLVPRMIAHCGTRSDLGNPQPEEAQASVLAPGGTNDPVALVLFAERACEDSRNAPSALWSLSLAHYRAAQSDKAIARTDQAIARRPDMARKYWPVLALAHAQLGHPDEARRWLAQARNWHQQEEQRRVSESAGFTTPEWADFEIIYREAAASVREHEPTGMKE